MAERATCAPGDYRHGTGALSKADALVFYFELAWLTKSISTQRHREGTEDTEKSISALNLKCSLCVLRCLLCVCGVKIRLPPPSHSNHRPHLSSLALFI